MITINENLIKLDTLNTSLIFKVERCEGKGEGYSFLPLNFVATLYYGKKIKTQSDYDLFSKKPMLIDRVGGAVDDYIKARTPYSTQGMGDSREKSLIIDNVDGTNVNRFEFYKANVIKGGIEFSDMPYARNGSETLELILKDEVANLTLILYYTIFSDSDVIAVCSKLINNNKESVFIKKIASVQCDLPDNKWLVSTYDGTWCAERQRHQTLVTAGTFTIDSKICSSSPMHNPFFTVEGTGINDLKYAFNLIYSGNHKAQVEISPYGSTRIVTGINDYLLNYEVKGGESFITPQAIMVSGCSVDELTSEMQSFTLNHIINPNFKNSVRPLLYNHWEGTGIDFNEELLLELADIAKSVGVELFVMDDGWFGNRIDDKRALGDWFVNKNKFPNGLKGLSDGIKSRGMKFGIWIEPEMINADSDIFRAHPEFAVISPNREPIERRNQLMMDMTNPAVISYLYDSLVKVFDECQPDYVKWDYNRPVIDVYSSYGFKAGEWYHKQVLGSYKLFKLLTEKYPNTLFEGCSSGGCRFDLGILFYTPQIWGSDDTNTKMRLGIQCGTLTAYPHSTLGAHVTADHCGMSSNVSSLEDRFNLNCIGAFGYEFDFRRFNSEELAVIKNQIEFYKKHRELLCYGNYYCIDNIFDDNVNYSYIVVSNDKSKAIFSAFEKEYIAGQNVKLYKLKGLDENAVYKVTERNTYNVLEKNQVSFTASGDALMKFGVDFGYLACKTDNVKYSAVQSKMFYLEKISD